MALKSTIYKAELGVSDLDRNYYATHALTLARHPSETEERLMVRLLAFAMFASEMLAFGRGLSTEGEPDLVDCDPTGSIRRWIDVGLPDERRLRKACGRAEEVVLLAYGGHVADLWWRRNERELGNLERLRVLNLRAEDTSFLTSVAKRSMNLQFTVQDDGLWLTDGDRGQEIVPVEWKSIG